MAIFEGPLSIRSLGLGTQYVYRMRKYHKKYFQLTVEGFSCTGKLGIKELFDKEQIGIKEPFPVTKCQFSS